MYTHSNNEARVLCVFYVMLHFFTSEQYQPFDLLLSFCFLHLFSFPQPNLIWYISFESNIIQLNNYVGKSVHIFYICHNLNFVKTDILNNVGQKLYYLIYQCFVNFYSILFIYQNSIISLSHHPPSSLLLFSPLLPSPSLLSFLVLLFSSSFSLNILGIGVRWPIQYRFRWFRFSVLYSKISFGFY